MKQEKVKISKSKKPKYRGKTIRQRGSSWQVDFGAKGKKRIQRSYSSNSEAKVAVDQYIEQQKIHAIDASNKRVAIYDLTDAQRMDTITALKKLPKKVSLNDAVDFYVQHNKVSAESYTIAEVMEEYVLAKKKANRRHTTITDIKSRIGRLARDLSDRLVHQVTSQDLDKWMDKYEYKAVSRLNYRTAFVGFFNYAKKQGYIQINPAEKLERPLLDEKMPEIMKPKEVESLMFAVESVCPQMIPYFAICLFAGLRPAEAQSLDWRSIDLEERLITVRPETAKKRRLRNVDVSDNLIQWLAPHKRDKGIICFLRNEFEKARKKAGVCWANDIMRHSYCSYHLVQHENQEATALQMGHINTAVLFAHYRNLVKRKEAEKFWKIKPKKKRNIIKMTA